MHRPNWEQLLDRRECEEPGPHLVQAKGIGSSVHHPPKV